MAYASARISRRANLSVKNPTMTGTTNQGSMAARNTAPTQVLGLSVARLKTSHPSAAPRAHEDDSPATCPNHMNR